MIANKKELIGAGEDFSLTFSAGVVDLDVLERPRTRVPEDGAVHGHLAPRLTAASGMQEGVRLFSK